MSKPQQVDCHLFTTPVNKMIFIIGAGVIGLSIGWQLSRIGLSVQIFERGYAGKEASFASAGMLAPYSEMGFEDEKLLALGEKSLALFPEFLSELNKDAEANLSFENGGTLYIGIDRDDRSYLEHLFHDKIKRGLPMQWLSQEEALQKEPLLSSRISAAVWLPTEKHIQNRNLIETLIKAFKNTGGLLHENCPVKAIWEEKGILKGIETEEKIAADRVVNAAGAWADSFSRCPIFPNKGQILTLKMKEGMRLNHVIRTPRAYLAPKNDGTLRIGATSEQVGFDKTVTGGGVLELLQSAFEAVPGIEFMEFQEALAALRPGSSNRLPIIGETSLKGYYTAIGHGRSGILLAPYTAYQMREEMLCRSL